MPTMLTPDQADAAAEVLRHLRRTGPREHTPVMTERARQVLKAQIGQYARAANSARRVSQILLPPLPGDDELDGAPVFATLAEAQAWYRDNAEGIYEAMFAASFYGADQHSSRVVRGFEQVMMTLHDVPRRLELAELALTGALHQGDELAQAHAYMVRGGGYKMGGRPALAVKDYRFAGRLFDSHNDAAGVLAALSRLAVAQAAARQLEDADDALDQVLALCGEGNEVLAGLAYVNRAELFTQRCAWDSAIEVGLEGLHRLHDCGAAQVWLVDAHLELAKAYTGAADFEVARVHVTEVRELVANGPENVPQRIAAVLAEAALLLEQGHHRDALASFQRAVMMQAADPQPYGIATALDGAGRAHAELGDFDHAAERHTSALRVRQRTGESYATAQTRGYLAKALSASGQNGEAAHQREQALLDLTGLVDPAADALRTELSQLSF
jgi:tetratricopeptide (TPR) repeat protein